MSQLTTVNSTAAQPSSTGSSDLFHRFSNISTALTDRLKESGAGEHFDSLIGGTIKNFLPVNKDLTVTKIVESIMDPNAASTSALQKSEHFLYFDPRSSTARGTMPPPSSALRSGGSAPGALPGQPGLTPGQSASFGQRRQAFTEAIVFTVGGGSVDEYGNLLAWAQRTSSGAGLKRRVVYGSTEIMNAEEFLKTQLDKLGKEVTT